MNTTETSGAVHELFHCPVVGICLSPVEQRCLLKKGAISPDGLSHYDMHELLVAALGTSGKLAKSLIQLLKERYERKAAPLRTLDEAAFLEAWAIAFARGDYRIELWAAATRELSAEASRHIHGQIHMAMHGIAEEQTGMRQKLEAATKKARRLEAKVSYQKETIASLTAETKALRKERADLAGALAKQEDAILALQQELANQSSSVNISFLEQENAELRRQEEEAWLLLEEEENAHMELRSRLETEMEQLRLENRMFRLGEVVQQGSEGEDTFYGQAYTVEYCQRAEEGCHCNHDSPDGEQCCCQHHASSEGCCNSRECNDDCPSFDLCSQRVLIVGGIERMESKYRKLVEEQGGILEYHAGHTKGGKKQLERCMQRADVVLCPVNCNSHGACLMVKDLARKYRKPLHLMPNFSMSAIAGVISAHCETIQQ